MVSKITNLEFWSKKGDTPMTIGDLEGRTAALALIDPKRCEKILDAGCGNGYMSRRLARREPDASIWGCDIDQGILESAILEEQKSPLGINYSKANICELPYKQDTFDKVCAVGVLMYNSPKELLKFFKESKRVLKKDGMLYFSLTHPRLYHEDSFARTHEDNWVRFFPLQNITDYSQSARFREEYTDKEGDVLKIDVWYHPKRKIYDLMKEAGLDLFHFQETYQTEDSLQYCHQKGQVGFPAFLQGIAKND